MRSLTNTKHIIMHQALVFIKDFIVTIVPSASSMAIAAELTNSVAKAAFALGSLVWLAYRILIIRREYLNKNK